MGILLLIAGQVSSMDPHKMEELKRNMRQYLTRIELGCFNFKNYLLIAYTVNEIVHV